MIRPQEIDSNNHQSRFRLTINLIYAIAALWTLFAAFWFLRDSVYKYFYSISAIGYAVVLVILAHFLKRREKLAWWAGLVFLGLNIILTVTDQVGWFDLIYLVPSIGIFVLFISIKPSFNRTSTTRA